MPRPPLKPTKSVIERFTELKPEVENPKVKELLASHASYEETAEEYRKEIEEFESRLGAVQRLQYDIRKELEEIWEKIQMGGSDITQEQEREFIKYFTPFGHAVTMKGIDYAAVTLEKKELSPGTLYEVEFTVIPPSKHTQKCINKEGEYGDSGVCDGYSTCISPFYTGLSYTLKIYTNSTRIEMLVRKMFDEKCRLCPTCNSEEDIEEYEEKRKVEKMKINMWRCYTDNEPGCCGGSPWIEFTEIKTS